MKQVLQSYRSGELWLADVEPPPPAPNGVRIRTAASLVSAGTERQILEIAKKSLIGKARLRPDLVRKVLAKARKEGLARTWEQVRDKLDTPVPLGYSAAGIVQDGEDAPGLVPGTRVAAAGQGYASHAEISWIPKNLTVPLPEGLSFEEGAFGTIGAIALQGVRQAEIRLGDRVVVLGLGLIGNLAAQLARAHGARVFGFDPSASRAALAQTLGCDRVESDLARVVDSALAWSGGHGADAVIVAASAPNDPGPLAQACAMARLRGKVVVLGLVGMEVPRDEAYKKELDVRMSMSYGPGRYDPTYEERGQDYPYAHVRYTEQRNVATFLEAVADQRVRVSPLVTHRFTIDHALEAYELIESGREPYLGVLLTYGPGQSEAAVSPRPRSASASPPSAFEPIRGHPGIGVLGAGSFLRGTLLPELRKLDAELVGVVNRTGPSAMQTAKSLGFRWGSTDRDRLLGDPQVHAIVIGTRHDRHADDVIAALEAGKHVFCEKPLCLDEAELARIAEVATKTGRYVQVGTNRRHSPYTKALKAAFEPRLDPILVSVRVNAGRLPPDHWLRDRRIGGGRLIGEGIHFVDLCQAIVGKAVVRAQGSALGEGPATLPGDSFALTLGFADGSLAQIVYAADGDKGLPKEHVEVFGLGRAGVVDDWSAGKVYRAEVQEPIRTGRGQQKGHADELRAFLAAVRTGVPSVPADVTWHVHHATFAAQKALSEGRPVEVAWPRPEAA